MAPRNSHYAGVVPQVQHTTISCSITAAVHRWVPGRAEVLKGQLRGTGPCLFSFVSFQPVFPLFEHYIIGLPRPLLNFGNAVTALGHRATTCNCSAVIFVKKVGTAEPETPSKCPPTCCSANLWAKALGKTHVRFLWGSA